MIASRQGSCHSLLSLDCEEVRSCVAIEHGHTLTTWFLFQRNALLQEEERLWTELIEKYGSSDAIWKADVVGRAYGNRGNARSRQGKMEEALSDFGEAIALCPWSVDPLLNRSDAFLPGYNYCLGSQ